MSAQNPLQPSNAAAALLLLDDGRYVMQLRDAIPDIFFPGHWGCFGGAVGRDETPLAALRRELDEELEYVPDAAAEFTRFEFDFTRLGQAKVSRVYFEISVSKEAFGRFVLHEGTAFEAMTGPDLLTHRRVTPYDAFAIWMHVSKRRFAKA